MTQSLVNKCLSNATFACVSVAFLSFSALLFAFTMQYVKGLDPCHLCLLQRWPYGATALLGLAGAVLARTGRHKICAALLAFCAVCFLGEAGLAFYHVGVERHWWASVFEGCTFSFSKDQDLMAQIEHKPAARCDEIAWSLFGLSMAGYNALLALGLCAASALSAILVARRANGF